MNIKSAYPIIQGHVSCIAIDCFLGLDRIQSVAPWLTYQFHLYPHPLLIHPHPLFNQTNPNQVVHLLPADQLARLPEAMLKLLMMTLVMMRVKMKTLRIQLKDQRWWFFGLVFPLSLWKPRFMVLNILWRIRRHFGKNSFGQLHFACLLQPQVNQSVPNMHILSKSSS